MEPSEDLDDFSLLGGPLHHLGCRLGLVRDGTNPIALGLVLGILLWSVLLALALAEGLGHVFLSIAAIGAHVRLLVTIPLLFVAEAFVDPRFSEFVRGIVRSRIVPPAARPALQIELARIGRWRDAWLPEAFFLLVTVLLAATAENRDFFAYFSGLAGGSASAVRTTAWSSQWYWLICITLFRFLWLRWLWRLALWSFLLWRISKLDLRLVPIHPDRSGGLGFLQVVHSEFAPLVLAISATQAASLANEIASGRLAFEAIYPGVAFVLVVDAVLFIGPLLIFSRNLWRCQVKGLSDYSGFAERYVDEFNRKWLAGGISQEPLLGSADIQSLADLSNSIAIVREMRLVPVSPTLWLCLAVAALLPLLPLVLFKYPIAMLVEKFFARMSGL